MLIKVKLNKFFGNFEIVISNSLEYNNPAYVSFSVCLSTLSVTLSL